MHNCSLCESSKHSGSAWQPADVLGAEAVKRLKQGHRDAKKIQIRVKQMGPTLTVTEELLDDVPRSSQFILCSHSVNKVSCHIKKLMQLAAEGHSPRKDLS